MASRASLRVSIPSELQDFVSSRVASGRYESASDVVCEGLRILEGLELAEDNAAGSFRPLIAIGLEQAKRGELLDGDEVFASLERRIGTEPDPAE
jgi:antitoxin ParD1/3/4